MGRGNGVTDSAAVDEQLSMSLLPHDTVSRCGSVRALCEDSCGRIVGLRTPRAVC
jgi:hypothetical protein